MNCKLIEHNIGQDLRCSMLRDESKTIKSSQINTVKGQSHLNLHGLTRRACDVISTILTESSIRYFFKSFKTEIRSSSDMPVSTLKLISLGFSLIMGRQTFMWLESPGRWKTTQCGSPMPTCSHKSQSKELKCCRIFLS